MKPTFAFLGLPLSALLLVCSSGAARVPETPVAASPTYGSPFWDHWGDGLAELAGYDLTLARYGAPRQGSAVTIFVTESFTNGERVKADGPGPDVFPVLKLNLVKDFPTGVYDYSLMTSTFVALESQNGRPAGVPTKVSFSSQEWCGHAYQQLLFDAAEKLRDVSHSYFQGEADQNRSLAASNAATAEDALFLWARGLAYPRVEPGESVAVPVALALDRSRLRHVEVGLEAATLSRAAATRTVTVPAGSFEVRDAVAVVTGKTGARTWTFWVEVAAPHRLIGWETTEGERAELLATTRLPYWKLNGPGGEAELAKLGLTPRGKRST
jgi:hypothetical protein